MIVRILSALAALFLLGAVLAGAMLGGKYLLLAEKSLGTVIELVEAGGMIHPIVEYRTARGEVRRHKGLGSDDPGYWVGQQVPIRYLPDNPAKSVISNSVQELWGFALALAAVGLVLAGVAWLMRRREPPPPPQPKLSPARRGGRVKRPRRRK